MRSSRGTRALLLVPFLLAAVPFGPSSAPIELRGGLRVVDAEVGYFDQGNFVPSARIDASATPNFGWQLRFEGPARQVSFREEFVLPAPAKQWTVDHDTVVAPDLASAVTRGRSALGPGKTLTHGWVSTPTDPTGHHTFRIWIDEVHVRELNFELY